MSSNYLDTLRQKVEYLSQRDPGTPEHQRLLAQASLEYAAALVDTFIRAVNAGGYSADQLNQIATAANRELSKIRSIANNDEKAEMSYQRARLNEAGSSIAEYDSIAAAKSHYESAISYSTSGTRQKLAFYQSEFAAFRRRRPNA